MQIRDRLSMNAARSSSFEGRVGIQTAKTPSPPSTISIKAADPLGGFDDAGEMKRLCIRWPRSERAADAVTCSV
jgi:hypothetical protein